MKVWIIVLKGFGYIWLTAALLLIVAGTTGTWAKGGFSAVQELLSPFNVANWVVTVMTLAPGFGALAWAEKLKPKRPLGPDTLAQPLQDRRAKASQSWEAIQKLVNNYGAILERHSSLIVSEDLLTASKQDIKQALIGMVRVATDAGSLSPAMREHLRVGYASLANFVSHDEAEAIQRYGRLLQEGAGLTGASDPRCLELAKELADGRYVAILQRSNDVFARLLQEFDAAVTA